jgi:hypothetical protein
MSERLRRKAPLLKTLYRASPALRKRLLRAHCDKDLINCLSDICRNILKGSVPLSASQKVSLRRKRKNLQQLALRSVSLKRKKKLIQSGGFLGALLGPIANILMSLIGG